jgi:hypothetical protein
MIHYYLHFIYYFIFLIYQVILNISTVSLSAEMRVLKNSLLANFEFKDLKNQCNKSSFPIVYKLIQVVMTILISSSTCERSFSAMHRFKNWLRTSIDQERFIKLSAFSIERDLTNKIDGKIIFEKFASSNRKLILV